LTIQLTWDDLLIKDFGADDASLWIAEWPTLVSGRFHPVFMSKFGDWFLRRSDGTTGLLDVLEGTLTTIAKSTAEFDDALNEIEWQEKHLLSWLVYELHQDGKIPAKSQCYGFTPHPGVGGQIDRCTTMLFDIPVWQTICSQTLFPRQ